MLTIGCTESNSDNTTSEKVYQDTEWVKSANKYSPLLGTDFENVQSAIENHDYSALATAGQNIVDDTQKALEENNQPPYPRSIKKLRKNG